MHYHDFWNPGCGRVTARVRFWLALAIAAGWSPSVHAQWITQANSLKAGWNSVYLHVDASHTNANSLLLSSPNIEEVWMWTFDLPPGLSLATPPAPTPSSRWSQWTRIDGANSVLKTLPGNAALLVKATAPFTWTVKGRPVPPSYRWTLTGLNFVGFPTASSVPSFETFLAPDAQALDWKQNAEIFRYPGGNLGTTNPIQILAPLQRSVPVVREQAYWIRTGEPTNQINNRYFGPFQVTGVGSAGLRFGDSQGQARLYLKNMTDNALTVSLREVASETSPTGAMPSLLPLMVRGPINTSNLTFGFSILDPNNSSQWTLAANGTPGSEVEIVLGVDRSQMGTNEGAMFAGVLRFTDSLGLTRVDIGASATTTSQTGLWVGNAVVDRVSNYLKIYAEATNAVDFHAVLMQKNLTSGFNSNPTGTNVLKWATNALEQRFEWDETTGRILIFSDINKGNYLLNGPIKVETNGVSRAFPLRLIVHNDGDNIRLMQRAYLGLDGSSNQVVAASQEPIKGDLANARRLSAVHLPTEDGRGPWPLNGVMQSGRSLETTVVFGSNDQASNPFLHTYHPDHDNIDDRDDTFLRPALPGKESYDLRRFMSLKLTAPGNDFDSRTRGGTTLTGDYFETLSFLKYNNKLKEFTVLKEFNVLGEFRLTRITDTANYAE